MISKIVLLRKKNTKQLKKLPGAQILHGRNEKEEGNLHSVFLLRGQKEIAAPEKARKWNRRCTEGTVIYRVPGSNIPIPLRR